MANRVTNCHPQVSIICAFTDRASTMRQLMLNRNVLSYQIDFSDNPELTLKRAAKIMLERKNFEAQDPVVVISDALAGSGFEAIQIRKIADLI